MQRLSDVGGQFGKFEGASEIKECWGWWREKNLKSGSIEIREEMRGRIVILWEMGK